MGLGLGQRGGGG